MRYQIIVALFIAASIAGGIFVYKLIRMWEGWCLRRRLSHGIKAERHIEKVLHAHGYDVVGIQQSMKMTLYVDGIPVDYEVRPDAIARRRKETFFVEAKTGNHASDPLYRYTRRQILEYYYSAPIDGVLLVDLDERSVKRVEFPNRLLVRRGSLLYYVCSFVAGSLCALYIIWRLYG